MYLRAFSPPRLDMFTDPIHILELPSCVKRLCGSSNSSLTANRGECWLDFISSERAGNSPSKCV